MPFHDHLGTKDLNDKDNKSKVACLLHHVKTISVLNPTDEIPISPYSYCGLQEKVTLNSSNLRNKHLCFFSLKMENIYK